MKEDTLKDTINLLNKKYGEGSLINLTEDYQESIAKVSTGLPSLDMILGGGIPEGRIVEIFGMESCLAGNTFIQYAIKDEKGKVINGKGGTIENLYNRYYNKKKGKQGEHLWSKNKSKRWSVSAVHKKGYIFQNPIAEVVKCGIKECFSITTNLENNLICTKEHKFYIGAGIYKSLEKLSVGDTIFIHNNTPFKGRKKAIRYAEVFVKYHPTLIKKIVENKYVYCRVKKSHIVYEAHLNNLSFKDYVNILNTETEKEINKLKFVPKGYDIHHKDKNPLNNKLINLVKIKKKEHYKMHALQNQDKMSFIPVKDVIKSIEYFGETETYDIKCFAPNNNYIANGIIVHNSGKTTLALQILAQCQKAYSEKKVAFMDLENALDPIYAKKIGIDLSKMYINQANSGEEALDIVEKLAQSNAISCIVVDSVSNLVPQAVVAKEIDGTANIGTTARLMSQTLPRLSNAIRKSNTILIFINQIRMKIGVMYGSPETTGGGMALKFNASQRIEIRGHKAEERNGREGIPVKITIKKNKIAPPFRQTEAFLVFGEGFSVIDDMIETAVAKNIIQKSGGWFVYEKIKTHGMENLRNEILEDKKLENKLLQEVSKK